MDRLNLKKVRIPARVPKMSKDPFIQGAGKIPKLAWVVHSMPKCEQDKSINFFFRKGMVTYRPPVPVKPLQLTVYLHPQAPRDPRGMA